MRETIRDVEIMLRFGIAAFTDVYYIVAIAASYSDSNSCTDSGPECRSYSFADSSSNCGSQRSTNREPDRTAHEWAHRTADRTADYGTNWTAYRSANFSAYWPAYLSAIYSDRSTLETTFWTTDNYAYITPQWAAYR